MTNIIDFSAYRRKKKYSEYLDRLDAVQLREEAFNFIQEYKMTGCLTRDLVLRGKLLFTELAGTSREASVINNANSILKRLDEVEGSWDGGPNKGA